MKSFILSSFICVLLLLCAFATTTTTAFAPPSTRSLVRQQQAATITTPTSLNVFGNKKSASTKAAEKETESKYWQGEWVCKDCGYIYNRVRLILLLLFFHHWFQLVA